jgi:leucyl-tRNA synthetase
MTHKAIRKVTEDLGTFRFNTMLAALMEFTNYLVRVRESGHIDSSAWREAIDSLLLLLAPSTPHLAEELWNKTGHPYSIHNQSFPTWSEELAADEQITLVIQVNGKLRDKVPVAASISETEAREVAMGRERVKNYIRGREIVKIIYVPGKLINIVAR